MTNNYVSGVGEGIVVGAGSTVIGNTYMEAGIRADCPANLTHNTAINNHPNLVLGQGCHNEDNVALQQ